MRVHALTVSQYYTIFGLVWENPVKLGASISKMKFSVGSGDQSLSKGLSSVASSIDLNLIINSTMVGGNIWE